VGDLERSDWKWAQKKYFTDRSRIMNHTFLLIQKANEAPPKGQHFNFIQEKSLLNKNVCLHKTIFLGVSGAKN